MNRRLHALAAALCLAGCAAAPVTLVTLPQAPPAQAEARPGASVLLREVRLPGYLESYPVVVGRDGSTLVIARDAEWAERLSVGATRVLRDALAQQLGSARVVIPGDGRLADAELAVEFLALDPQDGAIQLDARWFYRCAGGGGAGGRTRLQVPAQGANAASVAAATAQALTEFGAVLAAGLPCSVPERAAGGDIAPTGALAKRRAGNGN